MARAKTKTDATITLTFSRSGNPWIDAGTVGLYRVLMGRPSYVKDAPGGAGALPGSPDFREVTAELCSDRLTVAGPVVLVQACLEKAYDRLVACCYDVSSKKQEEETKKYNFYYDTAQQVFVAFPKKRAAGAALLLFDKAARPAKGQKEWGTDPDTGKRAPGRLPPALAHLQSELDRFLAERHLKPGPPAGLLIDGGNEVRPKMEFNVSAKPGRDLCFLTGKPYGQMNEAKNTAFPLFGGSRSFVNGTSESLRIGWQIDFVGKFAPAVAFFYLQGDDLHVFIPEAISLCRLDEMATRLQSMKDLEPNLYRNFKLHLGGYFQGRSEVAMAFLHSVFVKLSEEIRVGRAENETPSEEEDEGDHLHDDLDDSGTAPAARENEDLVFAQAVYDATLRGGSVGFVVVSGRKKGPVWMPRDFWTFHDVVYLARLFEKMQERQLLTGGLVKTRCRPRSFMNALIDFEAKKDKTLLRNHVCDAILNKRGVLGLLERHAFHVHAHTNPQKRQSIASLRDFAVLYETERYEGSNMTKEEYKKMVDLATWLGNNIADGVFDAVRDPERRESASRAKGAFFRLRKARTTTDFLDELARLQNRYPKIGVPPNALARDSFNHASYEEYRGFCVVAALSRYQWKASS